MTFVPVISKHDNILHVKETKSSEYFKTLKKKLHNLPANPTELKPKRTVANTKATKKEHTKEISSIIHFPLEVKNLFARIVTLGFFYSMTSLKLLLL